MIMILLTLLSSEVLNQYELMYLICVCRFRFVSLTNTTWTVNIATTFTNIDWSEYNNCTFSNMTRTHPNRNLYQPFVINKDLSYACAAHPYNIYNSPNCSDCDCYDTQATVTLQGLQVSF